MSSQRYRVTINGFRCNAQTWDDALNWDGKADEVFISTSVKYANKDGKILFQTQTQSPVMGDTWNLPNRIQVGSAWGGYGGIISGDSFPTDSPWKRAISLSQARDYPPMSIWEGDLTKGEQIVFITPTIWEWDPGQNMWEGWVQWQKETDEKFGQKAKEIVTKVWPPVGWVFDAVSLGIQTAATLLNVSGPLGTSGSRPIGFKKDLIKDPTGKAFSFNPRVLALNYDLAELLIAQEPIGLGNGVFAITYDEDRYFQGNYTLYLQVERVGPPKEQGKGGGYESLGGVLTSGPAVSSWGSARLDVFARGTDNALWHLPYDGKWGTWEQLGTNRISSNPAAVAWGANRIDVFVRGTDNALYHKWWDGNQWSGYEGLGGVLTSGLAVSSWGSGRLDVFARGTDNALWHLWYEGGWSTWEQLGANQISSDPAAVSWGPNRIDVFVRGTDNALYHKWWDGNQWSGYEGLGSVLTSGPAVSSWDSGRLDVFARGTDNALWHLPYDGRGWGMWEQLGTNRISSNPAAVAWGPNRIDVFVRGTDNALYHKWWDGIWRS
jgi:hypothetical protein